MSQGAMGIGADAFAIEGGAGEHEGTEFELRVFPD